MKRLILFKTCQEIQLAHLYEHMYLEAVYLFLKRQDLLNYLDYRYHGKAYQAGFVHIEVQLYTPKAQRCAEALSRLELAIDEESVDKLAAQVAAERQKLYLDNGAPKLHDALRSLHAQPWQSIDQITWHDKRWIRRSHGVFWLSDTNAQTRVLRSDFIFDDPGLLEKRELLPLFHVITSILQDNIWGELSHTYGFYMYGDKSIYSNKIAKEVTKFRIIAEVAPDMKSILHFHGKELRRLNKADVIPRTISFLTENDTGTTGAIDELAIFNACGVLMGTTGWQKIVTEDNLKKILNETTLWLTLGQETRSLSLKGVL